MGDRWDEKARKLIKEAPIIEFEGIDEDIFWPLIATALRAAYESGINEEREAHESFEDDLAEAAGALARGAKKYSPGFFGTKK